MSNAPDSVSAATEAINARFDGEYDRAEDALIEALGQVRKEREQQRRAK